MQALIAPAIVSVFFLGIFSNRITPKAGFWGLVLGFIAGMLYLLLDLFPGLASGNGFLGWIGNMNWLYYCCLLLVFTIVAMVTISFFTEAKSDEELSGLTHRGVTPEQAAEVRESWNTWDVVHTAIILGIIVLCYVAFF